MATLAGSIIGTLSGDPNIFGRKPVIPPAPTAEEILKKTVGANLTIAPEAARLAEITNRFNQENILANLRRVLGPEAVDKIPGAIGEKLYSEVRGEISPDVLNRVRNISAAEGLGRGIGVDSGMFTEQHLARILGTSYEISNRALGAYEQWLSASARLLAPTFDLTNMFASPAMGSQLAQTEWQIADYMAKTAAAPDPGKRGASDTAMFLIGAALSAYGGGAGYQNYNRPPWQGGGGYGGGGGGPTGSGEDQGYHFFGLGGYQPSEGFYMGKYPGAG